MSEQTDTLPEPSAERWCTDREHPFITYNPWTDRTYCRCGQRQEPGEQPMDWTAKRAVFHQCEPGSVCDCYAVGKSTRR
jgi:hypothetical protein